MRRVLALAFLFTGAVALVGCPGRGPRPGECRNNDDCAKQEGVGRVCVEGQCRECAEDADCKDGFVCRANQCVPEPQCGPNRPCPQGQDCVNDRCVEARATTPPPGDGDQARGALPPECDPSNFTIRFEFDQASVTGEATQRLQQLADCVRKGNVRTVVATGHADERGTSQYNVALSARRAEAAKSYLEQLGAKTTIQTVPNGEESPLCTESTEECWSRNRRVEFSFEQR